MVCIAEPCGSLSDVPTKVNNELVKVENRLSLIQDRLRPNFTCSTMPANLNKVAYDIHPALAALWHEAEEWHLLASDHCDVYGFNVWSPAWLDESTEMVFDGKDGREEWLKKHKNQVVNKKGNQSSIPSCASNGWVCCMAFSEFDYLLICLNKDSPAYGHVHHINTHTKKESYCSSMDELLGHLANFIEEGKARADGPMFGRNKSSSTLPRPLRLLRKAVIDAICR
mmetsp:Transcript_23888/g.30084  ORF Transcript_23888/g.30084 Transcript_23888/m.30084 type:complete len:226 (-) Transcript_23888:219-896(-)